MELERCFNFILTKAHRHVNQLFKLELAPFGVTPGQYAVLKCLWDENAQTARKIAERLYLDSSTITGLLDRMEQKGLIEKRSDPNDRRALQVVLTEAGKSLEEPVSQAIEAANRKALLVLDDIRGEDLKYMLDQISVTE
ncbi:MAG TPA: MarR family transcriptional regulator [Syntrophomonadaceae bacterium]|jgi:DNA-binding MarR family transcriptional regulator|nr:MarR family transcriptional regulator [Syntrophomonadaceae bacterium]